MAEAQLAVRDVHGWYGESHVLHGMTFDVNAGEVVTLARSQRRRQDHNHARHHGHAIASARDRSTYEGRGADSPQVEPHCASGHCLLPRGARHLLQPERLGEPDAAAAKCRARRTSRRRRSTSCFPISRSARPSQGTKLSGGEQQMLAIARILRTGAKLLLLDEPTEGLAPVIVQQIGNTIRMLRQQGFTILLVEQNFRFAATVADRHYVVEHGQRDRHDPQCRARGEQGEASRPISVSRIERSNAMRCEVRAVMAAVAPLCWRGRRPRPSTATAPSRSAS